MEGRVISPEDGHTIIPGTCEYVILHGKRDANVIKVKEPERGRVSWIIQMGLI